METVNKLQAYNKAWAALITSIVTLVVTIFGLNLDPAVSAAIVTLGTTIAVWAIPNK